jgi:hypothetical protein
VAVKHMHAAKVAQLVPGARTLSMQLATDSIVMALLFTHTCSVTLLMIR